MDGGSELRILRKLKRISRRQLTILAATLLLTTGFSIWLYTTSAIQGHTQLLNTSNLTQEEVWSHEGALQWWQTAYTTTIFPLTAAMITVGFVSLVGPTVWSAIRQRNVLKAFAESLERASTEKFEID